jgi:hypothetical protein
MAPFPLFRWTASIGILIGTALGSTDGVSRWWHENGVLLIIAAAIAVGPEITRIEFGGMRMELLRETRAEVRALGTQVSQLQVQQAAASSNASAGVNQTFHGMAAAVDLAAATKQGEETPPVPAQQVDWFRFTSSPRGKTPSAGSETESTVRE